MDRFPSTIVHQDFEYGRREVHHLPIPTSYSLRDKPAYALSDEPRYAMRDALLDDPPALIREKFPIREEFADNRLIEADTKDDEVEGALLFSDCVLLPPLKTEQPVSTKMKKPPGCKTIFIGGLPNRITLNRAMHRRMETIFEEIFTTNGGVIESVRIRDKGFCHIRFKKGDSVDSAMLVNGYYVSVKVRGELPLRFRLILEYSSSKEDKEEYQQQKEMAAKLKLKEGVLPHITPYNTVSAGQVLTDLGDNETYVGAILTIRCWIDSGRIDPTSIAKFFKMFQLISDHVKRIATEGEELNAEMSTVQERYNENLIRLKDEIVHLVSVFEDTRTPKCWDRLNRTQRRSLETWLELAKSAEKAICSSETKVTENGKKIKNEKAETTKADQAKVIDEKEKKIQASKKSIEDLQQQIWEMAKTAQAKSDAYDKSNAENEKLKKDLEEWTKEKTDKEVKLGKRRKLNNGRDVSMSTLDTVEARILCSLSALLHLYPNGTTTTCMQEYLKEQDIAFEDDDVDSILGRFPNIFSVRFSTVNGKTVKKWIMQLAAPKFKTPMPAAFKKK